MLVKQSQIVKLLVALGVDAETWDVPKLAERVNRDSGIARYVESTAIDDPELKQLLDDAIACQSGGNLIEITAAEPAPDFDASGIDSGYSKVVLDDVNHAVTGDNGFADAKSEILGGPSAPPLIPESSVPELDIIYPDQPETVKIPAPVSAPKTPRRGKKPTRKRPLPAGPDGKRKMTYAEKKSAWKKKWGKTGAPLTDRGVGIIKTIVDELKRVGKYIKPRPITKKQLLEHLKSKFPDREPERMWTYLSNVVPTRLRDEYHIYVQSILLGGGEKGYFILGDGSEPEPKVTEIKPKKTAKKKRAHASA